MKKARKLFGKNVELADLAERLQSPRNYGDDCFKSREFLQDFYRLSRGIKRLSHLEQYFIKDFIQDLRKNVNNYSIPKTKKFNPLNNDLESGRQVFKCFLQTVSGFSEGFVRYPSLNHLLFRRAELGKIKFNPKLPLLLFRDGVLLEDLGFDEVWAFTGYRIREVCEDARKANKTRFGRDLECAVDKDFILTILRNTIECVRQDTLPNPIGKNVVHLDRALDKIASRDYKKLTRERLQCIVSVYDYGILHYKYYKGNDRRPVILASRIPSLRTRIEEVTDDNNTGLNAKISETYAMRRPFECFIDERDMPKGWEEVYLRYNH